ncbi:hypothetical protein QF030_006309 [Streptomyces rishiriensis]|uniref:Uncharacterized protein n=1 Tax=Streptomyces rishiriensis TaxID=68264 RepID=A0ABU0NYA2_STRRH|nr:hypothetical protein [Streptomyces rishiriensis]
MVSVLIRALRAWRTAAGGGKDADLPRTGGR